MEATEMVSRSPGTFRLPPPAEGRVDLLIVAGEHSGDEHGARMVRELRTKQPGLAIAALGGPELAAAGAKGPGAAAKILQFENVALFPKHYRG